MPRQRLPPNNHHKAPLPREVVAAQPFIWDGNGWIIAPWPRHSPLWFDEEAKLLGVLKQVDEFAALRQPCWLWPDGRAPVPIEAADPNFVDRWAEGRASYRR